MPSNSPSSPPPINHHSQSSALSGLRQVVLCHKWVGAGGESAKRRSTPKRQQQQQQQQIPTGRTSVQLTRRTADSLVGLTLSGSRDGKTRISQIKFNSVAERCDSLEVNDVIVSVNGKSDLSHDQIADLIKYTQINVPLTVEVDYEFPLCTFSGQEIIKTLEVYLSREHNDAGFGFVARNAIFTFSAAAAAESKTQQLPPPQLSQLSRKVYVTSVRPNGPADSEGSIKTGDRIIAANGISVGDADELYTIMLGAVSVRLLIEYDVELINCSGNGAALLVEIEKSVNVAIGICVAQRWINQRSFVVVDYVKPASIADRCGAIRVGDILLSVDNHFLEGPNSIKDARRLLRSATMSENVKLEVASLPANSNNNTINNNNNNNNHHSHINNNNMSSAMLRRNMLAEQQRHFPVVFAGSCGAAGIGSCYGGVSHLVFPNSSYIGAQSSSLIRSGCPKLARSMFDLTPSLMRLPPTPFKMQSAMRLRSLDTLVSPYAAAAATQANSAAHICHTESTNVCLQVDEATGNFGFTLQSPCSLTGPLTSAPIVGYVDPDGPAASCCLIQPGDRVVSVNGQRLDGLTLDNARSLIKESGSRVNLEIEFEVAESVSLSSGVFQVKLLKKCFDLGLNIIYPKNVQSDESPMVTDVRRGSIAHRSGMINTGDRLLAIDHQSVIGKPISEVNHYLASVAPGEIVKLKLRKDEYCTDDNLNDQGVTYTIEIQRQGGPLGITISAPDEPFDPVVVSGLSSGGLVERTNAIHIGDRILAINGISLRGKGLNEALKLLQCGQDPVTLKIFRPLLLTTKRLSADKLRMISDHNHHNQNQNQHDNANSLDSALESWVGSHLSDQRLSDQSPEVMTDHSPPQPSRFPMEPNSDYEEKLVSGAFPSADEEDARNCDSDGHYDNCS